jgi:phosphatidylglycerol---prolipoprotein diacylglyceryl transferase
MYPTLFTIGSVSLQTAGVFSVLAFLLTGFIFWKKGREEHFDEVQIFDGFILSTIFSFILARITYIALNFDQFGFNAVNWLDIFLNPGIQPLVFLWGSAFSLYLFANKKKWNQLMILDFWSMAVVFGLIFKNIGYFFSGNLVGLPTKLLIGVAFPNMAEKSHPVQLYWVVFYALLFWFLSWAENNYRSFEWYRSGKKTARSGFVFASMIIFYSLFSIAMYFLKLPEIVVLNFPIDLVLYGLSLIFGSVLLWKRAKR